MFSEINGENKRFYRWSLESEENRSGDIEEKVWLALRLDLIRTKSEQDPIWDQLVENQNRAKNNLILDSICVFKLISFTKTSLIL